MATETEAEKKRSFAVPVDCVPFDAPEPADTTPPPWMCERCLTRPDGWQSRCPECGARYSIHRATGGEREPDEIGIRAVSPLDLEIEEPRRMRSGFASLDTVLGGGWVRGKTALIGGRTGSGKTTLLLCAAQRARTRTILLASSEPNQDERDLSLACRRLGVTRAGVRLFASTLLDSALDQALRVNAQLVILDSVTRFRAYSDAGPIGSDRQVQAVIARAERWAATHSRVVVFTSHVTKTSGAIKGNEGIRHDAQLVLDIARDPADPRVRRVSAVKSRQSQAQVHSAWFRELSSGALVPCRAPQPPTKPKEPEEPT